MESHVRGTMKALRASCPEDEGLPFLRSHPSSAGGRAAPRRQGPARWVWDRRDVQLGSAPGPGATSSQRPGGRAPGVNTRPRVSLHGGPRAPRTHLSPPAARVSGGTRLPRCPLGVTLWSRMTACGRLRRRAAVLRLDVFLLCLRHERLSVLHGRPLCFPAERPSLSWAASPFCGPFIGALRGRWCAPRVGAPRRTRAHTPSCECQAGRQAGLAP